MLKINTIINRYIIKQHIAPFIFGTALVMLLFLMQFLINHLDKFIGKGLSPWIILQLIAFQLAWMITLAVPMGTLFSTLMTFGNLSSNSEITIIKASGGSLFFMLRPIILIGLFLTLFVFWFNNSILPESNQQAKILMADITRKKPTFALESGQFSSELTGYTILARQVDSLTGKMSNITIYDKSKFNTFNIINADSGYIRPNATFNQMILSLYNGEVHQNFITQPNAYRIIEFKSLIVRIDAEEFAFKRSSADMFARGDREMNIADMQKIVNNVDTNLQIRQKEYIDIVKAHFDYIVYGKGYYQRYETSDYRFGDSLQTHRVVVLRNVELLMDYFYSSVVATINMIESLKSRKNQYIVEIQKKYAIPVACLIFILIGAPLGIVIRKGNFGISAILSLGFYIIYWIFLIGGEKLADRNLVSPYVGMWMANIVIGFSAIVLTLRVNYESFGINFSNILKKINLQHFSNRIIKILKK